MGKVTISIVFNKTNRWSYYISKCLALLIPRKCASEPVGKIHFTPVHYRKMNWSKKINVDLDKGKTINSLRGTENCHSLHG